MSWLVIIEWDGAKPPTRFYDRMHGIGLYVRGNKDESPLQRRADMNLRAARGGDPAIICQEGAVVCGHESTARLVYQEAEFCGAKAVQLHNCNAVTWSLSTEDARAFKRIEDTFGKRGRPSIETVKQDWVVTCFEHAASFPMQDAVYAEHCPECSGTRVRSRPGVEEHYKVPSGDVFEAWKRHRFVNGTFERPIADDTAKEPPKQTSQDDDKEAATVRKIAANKDLIARLAKLKRESALAVLDAIFCSRTYISDTARKENRIRTVVALYEKGIKPTEVGLLEMKDAVEFVDASGVLPPEKVAAMFLATKERK